MSRHRSVRPPRGLRLTCFAALLAPPLTHADEALDPVTVTAFPLESRPEARIAHPVSVLRGDDLRKRQGGGIGEVLSNELGVSTTDFGPGASRPVIRGLAGPRVRVLANGIGSRDVSTISDDHAVSLESFGATQIEILKGPATLLYGSGAIGGVVNIVDDRIPSEVREGLGGQLDLRYDTATVGRIQALSLDLGHGEFALHADGMNRESNNYESGVGKIFNSATDTQDYAVGGAWIGARGNAGFGYNRYQSEYQIPGNDIYIDLEQDHYNARAALETPFRGVKRLQTKLGYSDYTHTEFEASGEAGTVFFNEEFEGRFEALLDPIASWNSVLGVQYQNRDFEAVGEEAFVPPVARDDVGVFWVGEREWQNWHFDFGLRYERAMNDATGGNPDVDHDVFSAGGGAIWEFTPGYSLGASFTRAQRAPAIEELYSDGPHEATETFEIGDARLDEETAHNLDLALRKTEGRWTWRANAYANFISDYIYLSSVDQNGGAGPDGIADRVGDEGDFEADGELLLQRFAQDDARFYGGELETGYRLLENAWGELDGRLFMDYVRAKLDDAGNLPRIPPFRFGGGLDWTRGAWAAGMEVIRYANQGKTAPLETGTEGYTLLNLDLSYDVTAGPLDYSVFLRATNLLDEEARRHTSFLKDAAPLAGRSGMIGLRATF